MDEYGDSSPSPPRGRYYVHPQLYILSPLSVFAHTSLDNIWLTNRVQESTQ